LSCIVTLNLFQGPWPELSFGAALNGEGRPWMLKRVQHDEERENMRSAFPFDKTAASP
jgi:hypothetical protein